MWKLAGAVAAMLVANGPLSAAETVTYTYDAQGRVIKVERTGTVNNGVKTEYKHDRAGNRTTVIVTGSPNPAPSS